MTKRQAIFAGSFDPITLGHLNLIERSSRLFDTLDVVLAVNSAKTPLFTVEERIAQLETLLASYPNVHVSVVTDELMAEYAKRTGACCLIRGVRNAQDVEYETILAQANQTLNPNLETLFLTAAPQLRHVSSSLAKEIARYHGPLDPFVPETIREALYKRINQA